MKIAQRFNVGFVDANNSSPGKDDRIVVPSLSGLSQKFILAPALKGWAIFGMHRQTFLLKNLEFCWRVINVRPAATAHEVSDD
jgi:hypothetical protein